MPKKLILIIGAPVQGNQLIVNLLQKNMHKIIEKPVFF